MFALELALGGVFCFGIIINRWFCMHILVNIFFDWSFYNLKIVSLFVASLFSFCLFIFFKFDFINLITLNLDFCLVMLNKSCIFDTFIIKKRICDAEIAKKLELSWSDSEFSIAKNNIVLIKNHRFEYFWFLAKLILLEFKAHIIVDIHQHARRNHHLILINTWVISYDVYSIDKFY